MTDSNPMEPYKGLRPYEKDDQEFFFGRDAERNILIAKILANRLTLLFAASGVGKSSLLQAAVRPRLEDPNQENLGVVYFNDWVTPPLAGLKQATLKYLTESQYLDPKAPEDEFLELDLDAFFRLTAVLARPPLVVILDQFEELFRYQRTPKDLEPFVRELSAAIKDRESPTAFVLSMREDHAMALNVFKPYLSNLLFENYYRLENLRPESADAAMIKPVEIVGFRYEDELLDALREDLPQRDDSGSPFSIIGEWVNTVEPTYLQVVCSQLWEAEKENPEKLIRYDTYKKKGRAKGIVKSYLQRVLDDLSASEKELASLAFNFLVTRRGTKMAYTAEHLAQTVLIDKEDMAAVLDKLAGARILRSQKRGNVLWYELYHDLFSEIVDKWNDAYKTKQRNKRAARFAVAGVAAFFALLLVYDIVRNATDQHFRLNLKRGISDNVELYGGAAGTWDVARLQSFEVETEYRRRELEPDKLFRAKPVANADQLSEELIGYLPATERVTAYWEAGLVEKALALANDSISDEDVNRSKGVLSDLGNLGSMEIVGLVETRLSQDESYFLKTELVDVLSAVDVPKATDVLVSILDKGESALQTYVLPKLTQHRNERARGVFLNRLNDPSASVRESVASALGSLGGRVGPLIDRSDISTLLKQLQAMGWENRQNAIVSLGLLGSTQAIEPLLALFRDSTELDQVKIHAAVALASLGSQDGRPFLDAAVKSSLVSTRRTIAKALEVIPYNESAELLQPLLNDDVLDIRLTALKALKNAESSTALPLLIDTLQNEDLRIREATAEALAGLGSADAISVIKEELAELPDDVRVNLHLLDALGKIGTPEAIEALLSAVRENEEAFGLRAYQILAKLRDPQALPFLEERLKSLTRASREWRDIRDSERDDFTDEQAERWRQRLDEAKPKWHWAFPYGETIARIDPESGVELLSHELADVRYGAWMGLGEVGTVELIETLDKMRDTDRSYPFRVSAYRAIDHILRRLEGTGTDEDFETLKDLLPKVKDRKAVCTRMEWTIRVLDKNGPFVDGKCEINWRDPL